MKNVTIKEIAARSGCSIATVSKTLNGTDRVSEETAARIRRIAEELGYRSNLAARALVKGTRRIAIVLFDTPSVVRQLLEAGFERAFSLCGSLGLTYEIHRYSAASGMSGLHFRHICADADALILTPGSDLSEYAETLDEIGRQIPLVFLHGRQPGQAEVTHLCDVTADAYTVGCMAARFLSLTASGKRTAVISGHMRVWNHSESVSGFLAAAKQYGLEVGAIRESFDLMERAGRCAEALLTDDPALAGLFVSSHVAPAVCDVVKQMQRNVKIIGVDLFGSSIDCLKDGSLTAAIYQNQKLQAQLALEAVIGALRGDTIEKTILVKPELVMDVNLPGYLEQRGEKRLVR